MRKVLSLLLLLIGSAAGQQLAVGFVSPNVRDHMTYETAKESLASFEETNFLAVADRVLCNLSPHPAVDSSIGEVHEKGKLGLEGAENSAVLRAAVSFDEMRYAVALLGRYAHQEYVIVFAVDPSMARPARLFTLRVDKQFGRPAIEKTLDAAGVLHRTLVDEQTIAALILPGDSDAAIRKAAQRLRARTELQQGRGEIIGDDDRLKAAAIYDRIIADFESAHPDHKLSPFLWSREWHDAITRTCTAPQ